MTAASGIPESQTQAARLERVYHQLHTLLHDPDVVPRLHTAPGEDAWSALQVVGHLVEMIPYWLHQCHRLIAATGEPPQFGRTEGAPERLAGVEAAATSDATHLLSQLQQVTYAAAKDIRHMTEAERNKTGVHVRQGTMSVAEVVEHVIIGHAEAHVVQVQEALKR
jgi:hypothetical protein